MPDIQPRFSMKADKMCKKRNTALFMLILTASLFTMEKAHSASLVECGELDNISMIPDPIADNTRSFLSGRITVTKVDTFGEPVCCSAHAIIHVLHEDEMGKSCFRLSNDADGTGYSNVFPGQTIIHTQPNEPSYLFVPVKKYPYAAEKPNHQIEMIRLRIDLNESKLYIE